MQNIATISLSDAFNFINWSPYNNCIINNYDKNNLKKKYILICGYSKGNRKGKERKKIKKKNSRQIKNVSITAKQIKNLTKSY